MRFAEPVHDRAKESSHESEVAELLAALAQHRVGGCYWGRQKNLPSTPYVLDSLGGNGTGKVRWAHDDDPWHLLNRAQSAQLPDDDPRALLAVAAGVPLTLISPDGAVRDAGPQDAVRWSQTLLSGWQYRNPFGGPDLTIMEAIALCAGWRRLIDANRRIHSVMGVAYWKKPTVTALLWAGVNVPYNLPIDAIPAGSAVAIWRSRLSAAEARTIDQRQVAVAEIEDGFIRSQGLGADCVPPLSIIVDHLGPHFAPGAPSQLEELLQAGDFSPEILERARALREAIIAGGLSKYAVSTDETLPRYGGQRRHILVPGQVEDDRAVTSGGALSSNLELLRRARAAAGADAYIIYKPHPDVLAGHRRGRIAEQEMAALADRVETASPIPALIAMADELHVNSSLAGFEALLRGKPVTVHGVPFYAGWGLTTDLGPVPARRTARRTLDELVAAALLLYPRYLDPLTGLPASAEVLAERLAAGATKLSGRAAAVVMVRRMIGRIRRFFDR